MCKSHHYPSIGASGDGVIILVRGRRRLIAAEGGTQRLERYTAFEPLGLTASLVVVEVQQYIQVGLGCFGGLVPVVATEPSERGGGASWSRWSCRGRPQQLVGIRHGAAAERMPVLIVADDRPRRRSDCLVPGKTGIHDMGPCAHYCSRFVVTTGAVVAVAADAVQRPTFARRE